MTRRGLLVGIAMIALVACSGDDDDAATSTTAAATPERSDDQDTVGDSTASTDTVPETTDLRPGVVVFDGSVESLVVALPDAQNFAAGVEEWLEAVPGQEGVFRNSRGITVFVPADDGFSIEDQEVSFADPDTAATTIGDHLHVGAFSDLTEFGGSIIVATGVEYTISDDGQTIGGRRVLRSEEGTNGVVFVIDGPLDHDGS